MDRVGEVFVGVGGEELAGVGGGGVVVCDEGEEARVGEEVGVLEVDVHEDVAVEVEGGDFGVSEEGVCGPTGQVCCQFQSATPVRRREVAVGGADVVAGTSRRRGGEGEGFGEGGGDGAGEVGPLGLGEGFGGVAGFEEGEAGGGEEEGGGVGVGWWVGLRVGRA